MTTQMTLDDGLTMRQTSSDQPVLSPARMFDVAGAPIRLEIIETRAGFDALEGEWVALFERAGLSQQVFQTFGWNWHWCNHYLDSEAANPKTRLAIVTGRRNGALVLIWPLVVERRFGLRILRWMGEPVSQYGDALVENAPDARELLVSSLRFVINSHRIDVVALRKVRADAISRSALAELGADVTMSLAAPYMDFSGARSGAAYESRFSSRDRKNRRRHRKRLSERGTLRSEIHISGPRARLMASQAIKLKRLWLHERGRVSTAFADQRFESFFADVAEGSQNLGGTKGKDAGCLVSTLYCDERPAAIEIALGCKGRVAAHVAVYDAEFVRHSPGTLLLEDTIEVSIRDGVLTHDFMAPADAYKLDWADGSIAVCDLAIVNSAAGAIYKHLFLGAGRRGAKYLIEHMPDKARRCVSPCYAFLLGI